MSEAGISFVVRPAQEVRDLSPLLPVLEGAIRNPVTHKTITEDVEDVMSSVRDSLSGTTDRSYLIVAESAGDILGVMGLQAPPDPRMMEFATTSNPAEVINAYVDKNLRGLGVGRALLGGIEELAASRGHSELLVNSGPRYRRSGWPFWTRQYGEPVAMAKDYYGTSFDAAVWRHVLDR